MIRVKVGAESLTCGETLGSILYSVLSSTKFHIRDDIHKVYVDELCAQLSTQLTVGVGKGE